MNRLLENGKFKQMKADHKIKFVSFNVKLELFFPHQCYSEAVLMEQHFLRTCYKFERVNRFLEKTLKKN